MRKWLLFFALLVMFLLPAGAKAQSAVGFDTLYVSVWPEYDTPTVLVIYQVTLGPQVTLPVQVTLRMPGSVGKVHVVAVGNSADTVSDSGVDYQFIPGGDYAQVTVKATARFIRLEYYDPGLIKTGNQRQFTYTWLGDNNLTNFRFEFRQPLQSSNVVINPPLTNTTVDQDGFQLSEFNQKDVQAGQKLSFNISYQRATDSPSTSFLSVQSSTPLDQTLPGQSTWSSYLPWGLGGLGLVLLLIAGWVYWSSIKNNRAASKMRKRHVVRSVEEVDDGQPAHCSQCGKRLQPGDRFCRACGARVRRVE
jgi:zinc-ribbon domain